MKRLFVTYFLAALLVAACTTQRSFAQSPTAPEADRVLGVWLTEEGTSKVEIYKCGEQYCGKIVWLQEPERDGKPRVDDKNPEERLRTQPLMGLVILRGFAYDDGDWTGGKIYDPKSGNDYTAKMKLEDENTLKLRGYVLVPLFGRTTTWKRQ